MAVPVDWDVIESVEDLDKVFKKAISRAEDADEPEIRQQWSESKATFFERRAQQAELRVAKREALDKYPLAKDFAEDIRGGTSAEIEAQAKRFHERMEKVTKDSEEARQKAEAEAAAAKEQAMAQYGQPAAAGGGQSASRPSLQSFEADDEYIRTRLAAGDGLQDSKSKLVQSRWQAARVARGIEAAIQNPSYRSFSRTATDDKKITDDRTRRRNG